MLRIFLRRHPFQVICAIVASVAVDMIDDFAPFVRWQEMFGDKPVNPFYLLFSAATVQDTNI